MTHKFKVGETEEIKTLEKFNKVVRYDGRIGVVIANVYDQTVIQWGKEDFSTHSHADLVGMIKKMEE